MAVIVEHQGQEKDNLHCNKEALPPRATKDLQLHNGVVIICTNSQSPEMKAFVVVVSTGKGHCSKLQKGGRVANVFH